MARKRPTGGRLAQKIQAGMNYRKIDSQAALARRLKMNRQTVHLWMSGQRSDLTPENLFKLADALGADARWLAIGKSAEFVPSTLSDAERRILDSYRNGNAERRQIMEVMASPHAPDSALGPGWARPDKAKVKA